MAEPEWDERTRALVLGHATWKKCPVCGGSAEYCQDPERQDDWLVPPPVRCHRTTALRQAQSKINETTNPHAGALIWSVQLTEGAR